MERSRCRRLEQPVGGGAGFGGDLGAGQHAGDFLAAAIGGKRVATRVARLAADHRREEIARMLAGAEITAEARAAAERLLKGAA